MSDNSVKDAATIMIVRDGNDGLQVFLVRRHAASAFMANRYVYPGGKVDPTDCTTAAAAHVEGLSPEGARRRLDEVIDPLDALGLFLAGIRETFEEAGVLLARRSTEESLIDLTTDETTAQTFATYRNQLIDGQLALSELARREDLIFPLDRLGYFAHWITPTAETHRYDTRFFIARAPARQEPLHDACETTDSTWIAPRRAIEQNRSGDFQLAPPTLCTLWQLAHFGSARAAFEWSLEHDPPTILPHLKHTDNGACILLPGDPDYPDDQRTTRLFAPLDEEITRLYADAPGIWQTPAK